MEAYKLPNGKLRIPVAVNDLDDEEDSILGDTTKDVDHDDPDAQKWIKWYQARGEVVPPLPSSSQESDEE